MRKHPNHHVLAFVSSIVLAAPVAHAALDSPVVGGTLVRAGEWPDVALVVAPGALCTGTLIAPDVVLTAGHCVDAGPFEIVLGTVDYASPAGQVLAVKQAIAYPDWQHTYDVGVLVLEHPAGARPRAIASACTVRAKVRRGATGHVVGFGLTTAAGTGDNTKLHEADLAITDASCSRDAGCNPRVAPGGELAAGGNGVDACFGDSGGPLYVEAGAGPSLVGVVSRGGGTPGEPCGGDGVYERADKVVAWIEQQTHRRLDRTPCDSPADDDGSDEADTAAESGCSAGAGGQPLGLAVLAMVATLALARRPVSRRG